MKTPSKGKLYTQETFISLFNSIAQHKHRYTVFTDFVTTASISLHNAVCPSETLEKEYLEIMARYSKDEVNRICELFSNFIVLLDIEPIDVLGSLYMVLELGDGRRGQFFSPPEISTLMAKMVFSGIAEKLETKPFITLSEPACGAGGMVLAFANEMRKQRINPAEKLFVQCIDIDRLAGFMCYLQLSLWYIPAQVIIGNSLTREYREVYYTPAYYLGNWHSRLRYHSFLEKLNELETEPVHQDPPDVETGVEVVSTNTETQTKTNTQQTTKTKTHVATNGLHQVDLLSEFDIEIDH